MAKTNGSIKDLDHLAELGTHQYGHAQPRMSHGTVIKEGQTRKTVTKHVADCPTTHRVNFKGKDGQTHRAYVQSNVFGVPKHHDKPSMYLRGQLKVKKRLEKLATFKRNALAYDFTPHWVELLTPESISSTVPDVSLEQCYSSAY